MFVPFERRRVVGDRNSREQVEAFGVNHTDALPLTAEIGSSVDGSKRSGAQGRVAPAGVIFSIFVAEMLFWHHALMKDARYHNGGFSKPVKNHMAAALDTPEPRSDVITWSTHFGVVRERLGKEPLQLIKVAIDLVFAPGS